MDGRVVLLGRPGIDAGNPRVRLAAGCPGGLVAYRCLRGLPVAEAARRAYGQAALARGYLRTGRFEPAGDAARAGAELARGGGAVTLVPWAMGWAASATLELGDETAAETTYAEAYTLGCEIGDPCWEALALRGLALVALVAPART